MKQRHVPFSPSSWSLSARLAARCGAEQCAHGADERVRHELAATDAATLTGRLWPSHVEGMRARFAPPSVARCPFDEASRAGAALQAWRLVGKGGAAGPDLRAAVVRHDGWAFRRFGYPSLTPRADRDEATWLSGLGCALPLASSAGATKQQI